MSEKFKNEVVALAEESLGVMRQYIKGEINGSDKIKYAGGMISLGVRVSHMIQHGELVKRSQAIRLLPYVNKEQRDEYISLTNPEAKPYLLSRPKADEEE